MRVTSAISASFSCFCRTNVENKVSISVPASQVNNAWSWVNNWSHTLYTFCSSLCWIIEGGIVIFWGTPGLLLPCRGLRCFTFSSASNNKEPSVWVYRASPNWAELHRSCSHNRHDLWMGAGQIEVTWHEMLQRYGDVIFLQKIELHQSHHPALVFP